MSQFQVARAELAPAGDATVLSRPVTNALFVRVPHFMLEDVVDAALAKAALTDPENADALSWDNVKRELGL